MYSWGLQYYFESWTIICALVVVYVMKITLAVSWFICYFFKSLYNTPVMGLFLWCGETGFNQVLCFSETILNSAQQQIPSKNFGCSYQLCSCTDNTNLDAIMTSKTFRLCLRGRTLKCYVVGSDHWYRGSIPLQCLKVFSCFLFLRSVEGVAEAASLWGVVKWTLFLGFTWEF